MHKSSAVSAILTPLALGVFALAGSPGAEIRWDAQGSFGIVVPGVPPPLAGIGFGDTVIVSMTFDPFAFAGTPVPLPTGQGTEYIVNPSLFSIEFPELGLDLTAEQLVGGTPEFILSIANDTTAFHPAAEDVIAVNVFRAGSAATGTDGVQFTWAAFAPTGFLSNTEIPISFGTDDFASTQIILSNAADNSFQGGGVLSSFTSTIVPAPATATLMMLGLASCRRRAH